MHKPKGQIEDSGKDKVKMGEKAFALLPQAGFF
jgi:hypothetical protein